MRRTKPATSGDNFRFMGITMILGFRHTMSEPRKTPPSRINTYSQGGEAMVKKWGKQVFFSGLGKAKPRKL